MMLACISPIKSMQVLSQDPQIISNLACCVQEFIVNKNLKSAQQILAQINILILEKIIPEASLD